MKDKHWAVEDQEVLSLLAEHSAIHSLRGMGINEQVKVLKREYPGRDITRSKLLSLKKHPKYKEVLLKEADEMVASGQIELKTGAAGLVPAVIACLKLKLAEGDVKAAVAVVNILVDKKDDEGPKQAQQLNITLASDTHPIKSV